MEGGGLGLTLWLRGPSGDELEPSLLRPLGSESPKSKRADIIAGPAYRSAADLRIAAKRSKIVGVDVDEDPGDPEVAKQ